MGLRPRGPKVNDPPISEVVYSNVSVVNLVLIERLDPLQDMPQALPVDT